MNNKALLKNKVTKKLKAPSDNKIENLHYYEKLKSLCKNIKSRAKRRVFTKYRLYQLVYIKNVVNKLIFNEKHKVVAIFKDYLILDDFCEFFKR